MIEFSQLMQTVMSIIALASLVATIVMTRGKATSDRVATIEKALADKASAGRVGALEDRVDKVEDRTTTMESEMRHLPSREQTHSMELALTAMQGQLSVLTEKITPIANTNARLQEYLLEESRTKREHKRELA